LAADHLTIIRWTTNKFITPWRANRGSPLNAIEVRPSSRASCRTGRSERQLVCGFAPRSRRCAGSAEPASDGRVGPRDVGHREVEGEQGVAKSTGVCKTSVACRRSSRGSSEWMSRPSKRTRPAGGGHLRTFPGNRCRPPCTRPTSGVRVCVRCFRHGAHLGAIEGRRIRPAEVPLHLPLDVDRRCSTE
jgi:hypothetical protein